MTLDELYFLVRVLIDSVIFHLPKARSSRNVAKIGETIFCSTRDDRDFLAYFCYKRENVLDSFNINTFTPDENNYFNIKKKKKSIFVSHL